jgi:nucleoside-diphosphate-sugar epimerase
LNLVHVDDAATLVDAAARSESMPPVVNGAMADVPTRRRYYEALAKSFEAPTPRFEQQENGEEPASDRRVVSTVRAQLCGFRYEDVDAALRAITSAS